MKKKKKSVGRPSKYNPEYANLLLKFFDIEPNISKDITITKADGTQIDKSETEPVNPPYFVDFCIKININQDTMLEWVKKYPEFSEAYKKAKELQKNIIITNALRGLYNCPFAIFTLKNIAGWRDDPLIDNSIHTHYTNILQQIRASGNGSKPKNENVPLRGDTPKNRFLADKA